MDNHRISTAGLKCIDTITALAGHTLDGLSNKDLCKRLSETPSNMNRTLNTLIKRGYVEQYENGRYALSIAVQKIAHAHSTEMARAVDRINEIQQRIATGSST